MPDEEALTPAEQELEAALGTLQPTAPGIDRDRLLFRAGRASGRPAARRWQVATAVLAACLAVSLQVRPEPAETIRIVRVPREQLPRIQPAPSGRPPAVVAEGPRVSPADPYARLCEEVVRRGLDALPMAARSSRVAPLSVAQLLGSPRAGRGRRSVLEQFGLWREGERQ